MIKRIALVVLSVFFLAFAGMGIFLLVNKDFIKNKAIASLNNELNAKVHVNGAIDLTIFENFPSVNLKLEQVYIEDKLRPNDTLALLQEVYLSLNPFSILKKDYTIDAISLKKGFVHLYISKDGAQNFDILEPSENDSETSTILNLKKIHLEDVAINYTDKQNDINAIVFTENSTISGVFEQQNFDITLQLSHLYNSLFEFNGTDILRNKNLYGKLKINFNQEQNCYVFDNNSIQIEKHNVLVNGSFCATDNTLNLTAEIEGESLENALSLVPKEWFTLTDYTGNGNYSAKATIKGPIKNPTFLVDFSLKNGTLNLLKEELILSNISLEGNYSTVSQKNGSLVLKSFTFNTLESSFTGNLSYPDLSKTIFSTKLESKISYKLLNKYVANHFNLNNGSILINDLTLELEKNEQEKWLIHNIDGDIDIQNIEGDAINIKQKFTCSGKLNGTKNYFSVLDFVATFGKNNLAFDGELKNLFELLLNEDNQQAIGVFGKIKSSYFNLNDFIQTSTGNTESTAENKEIIFPNLSGKLAVAIDEFQYQNLQLNDLQITAEANNKSYLFKVAPVKALGGTFSGLINSNVINQNFEINMSGNIEDIAIDQLFEAFNNFDLEELKKENIKGTLTTAFTMSALWENFNEFNTNKFILNSTLSLKDGELNNFKPLMSLSGKLDVEQLSRLQFDDLTTNIIIKNGVIQLPATEVRSNLLSLKVGGTHTFNNEIDYRLVLNLRNLLAAKFRSKESNKENYVNDITGGINIYVSITGTMDNPIIKYDRESVRTKIKQDFKEEKEEFKNLFKKNEKSEFEKNQIEFETQQEEEFIDWED